MNWIPYSFRRRKLFDNLSEEMRLHLEERVDHLIGEGLSPIEAQRQARIAFGNLAMLEERKPRNLGVANPRVDVGRHSISGAATEKVPGVCSYSRSDTRHGHRRERRRVRRNEWPDSSVS
jgi:hypothetical protein